jgi:hypothetical protein
MAPRLLVLVPMLFGLGVCRPARGDDPAKANPNVFFSDDFETGALTHWDNDNRDFEDPDIRLTTEPAHVHSGKYALEITAPVGKEKGGGLPKWFMPGFDTVYARWYCQFAEDFDQGNHMHFVHLLAHRTDNKWSAFGKAGKRPDGTDFFTAGFEPWRNWGRNPAPGALGFYVYYPEMTASPDGMFWGNMFAPKEPVLVERGRWTCMEMMVKLNDPDKSNGELAAWVDGKEIGRWPDMLLRKSDILKVNCFWLLLYVHDSQRVNRVWFDDVAVSHTYIGPME